MRDPYHVAVIVAHPDDESLWCGGTLLRLRDAGVTVTIVSLTNGGNVVRKGEFTAASRILGAEPIIFDLPDGGQQRLADFSPMLNELFKVHPDLVLTHADHGNERGHFQHRQCCHIVRRWALSRNIPIAVFLEKAFLISGESIMRSENGVSLLRLASGRRLLMALASRLRALLPRGRIKARPSIGGVAQYEIAVDLRKKHELLGTYHSQVEGMRQYEMYALEYEYIRFFDYEAAERFGEALVTNGRAECGNRTASL